MPPAHRKGDIGSGHGCHFPPSSATGGSPDVFVNKKALMRQGDSYAAHACPAGHSGPHGRALSGGSATVFVNGKPAGRKGDAIDCGGAAVTASGNVHIGDKSSSGAVVSIAATQRAARKPACQRAQAAAGTPFAKT